MAITALSTLDRPVSPLESSSDILTMVSRINVWFGSKPFICLHCTKRENQTIFTFNTNKKLNITSIFPLFWFSLINYQKYFYMTCDFYQHYTHKFCNHLNQYIYPKTTYLHPKVEHMIIDIETRHPSNNINYLKEEEEVVLIDKDLIWHVLIFPNLNKK